MLASSRQRTTQGHEAASIPFGVAVVEKQVLSGVWRRNRVRVLDRAPILFSAGGDLAYVGEQTVRVAAERTVDLLDAVQVRELASVDHEVGRAGHARDAVDRKADPLVDPDPRVEGEERKQQRIDGRCSDEAEHTPLADVRGDALPHAPMRTSNLRVEPYAPTPDAIVPPPLLLLDLAGEVVLRFSQTLNDMRDVE